MHQCNSVSLNSFLSLEVPESNNQKIEDYIFDLMLFSSAFRLKVHLDWTRSDAKRREATKI